MKLSTIIFGISITLCAYAKTEYAYTFEEIQRMTDISYSNAIPTLEEYLQIEDGNIRKYAAAQSLFLMNTPETRAVLEKHLFSSPYFDFQQSIRYAFHWSMDDVKRDEFIRTYHLRSTTDQLNLTVEPSYPTRKKDRVNIRLVLENTSDKPVRLYKPHVYAGKHILLISANGEVMKPVMTAMYKLRRRTPEECYVEVPPGESFDFNISGEIKTFPDSRSPEFRDGFWLDCGDFMHKLSHEGIFKVYGQYSYRSFDNPPFDNIWSGRIVSLPLNVTLERPVKNDATKTEPEH